MKIADNSLPAVAQGLTKLANGFVAMVAVLVMTFAMSGCTNPPDVPFTVPGNGATNVEVTTDIQIAFTTAMDPISSTDPANWSISGSLSGPHPAAGALNEDLRILTLVPETPFQQRALYGPLNSQLKK